MLLFVVVVAVEVVVVLVVALVAEEALFVVTHTVADDEALDGRCWTRTWTWTRCCSF